MELARNAWQRIGELFVEKALITGSELEQALAVQAASGRPLGEVLVSEGLISSPEMTDALVEQLGRKVAKEEGLESALWSEIRWASRMPGLELTTTAETADELNRRISQLTEHLTDTQLALDQERAAHEAAEKRIGELAVIVERLQTEQDERSGAEANRRRTVKRALFGAGLRLAQE